MLKVISSLILIAHCCYALIVERQPICNNSVAASGPCHTCECINEGIYACDLVPLCQNVTSGNGEKECEPKITYNYKDLYCTCNEQGHWKSYTCRKTLGVMRPTIFKKNNAGKAGTNHTEASRRFYIKDLPEIAPGEKCVAGKSYRIACNSCVCAEDNSLICTKMACLKEDIVELDQVLNSRRRQRKISHVHQKRETNGTRGNKQSLKEKESIEKLKNIKSRKYLRKRNTKMLTKSAIEKIFPPLVGDKCERGKIYSKSCRKCFCTENRQLECTNKCIQTFGVEESELMVLENKRGDLPVLPHLGAKCEPGKVYQVDCNVCYCSQKNDLMCSYRYCLDTKMLTKNEINKLSGKRCVDGFTRSCIKCDCVNSFTVCKEIPDCKSLTGKVLTPSQKVKLSLNINEEKCEPKMVYNVHCNKCYCQEDGSLRCTLKVCLNHSQVEMLQTHFSSLEKNSL